MALICLAVGALFTSFYMFRLIFMTFFGEYRGDKKEHRYSAMLAAEGFEGPPPHGHDDDHHDDHGHDAHEDHGHEVHESPLPMVVSLCVLAAVGLPGIAALVNGWAEHLLEPANMYGSAVGEWVLGRLPEGIADHASHIGHESHNMALLVSTIVAWGGLAGAIFLYLMRPDLPSRIASKFGLAYVAVRRRFFVDEVVDATVLRPTMRLALVQRWIDEHVVDGLVLAIGRLGRAGGSISAWVDRTIVDGAVNAVGLISQSFGSALRLLQTGRVQQYAALAVGGGILTAAWLILS